MLGHMGTPGTVATSGSPGDAGPRHLAAAPGVLSVSFSFFKKTGSRFVMFCYDFVQRLRERLKGETSDGKNVSPFHAHLSTFEFGGRIFEL